MNAPFSSPKPIPRGAINEEAPKHQQGAKIQQLLVLEAQVREVETLAELQYLIANETRKLISARQVIVHRGNPRHTRWRIEKISSVSEVDRNAPLLKWLHDEIRDTLNSQENKNLQVVSIQLDVKSSKITYPFVHGFYLPFRDRKGNILGGMSLFSEKPISEQEMILATRLANTYAYAWAALKPVRGLVWHLATRRNALIITVLIILAGFIPVPLTVLAPVEVVARDAIVIAAPIEGVIEEILVNPNSVVRKGDLLFRYNALDFENSYNLAVRNVAVTSARYQRSSQSAFGNGDGRRELAITKAENEVARAEMDFTAQQMAMIEVRAITDGIVLFSGKEDWTGRPVSIGERIMRLADDQKTELKIRLPVADAIILGHDAKARIFLDSDPLNPLSANLTRTGYSAEKEGEEPLFFPVIARFNENQGETKPRIGLRGTAQLSGESVQLAFNLFRKPLSAIRQYLGM